LLLCEEVVGLILCESRRRYAKVCRQKLMRETEVEIEMKKEDLRACGRVFLEKRERRESDR
jgi:hypothetical protein